MISELAAFTDKAVQDYLREHDFDAMVVTSYENCYYLSGVFLYYNAVVVKRDAPPVLLVKYIDRDLAVEMSYLTNIRAYSPYLIDNGEPDTIIADYPAAIARVLTDLGCAEGRICISDLWSVLRPYLGLQECLPKAEVVVTEPFLERLRCVKQPKEIELIGAAVELIDESLDECAPLFHAGQSENVLAGAIARSMWARGGELAHLIVAAGERSMLPHSKLSGRRLVEGENVVVDLVSYMDGYYAGLTRTFVVGKSSARQRELYDVLLATADVVYSRVRPGMEIGAIARLALHEFETRGLAENTKHAFGHAIGTFQHETPILNRVETRPLEVGMVFCFEPGIYLPDQGGFRLGDLVVMREDGLHRVSDRHRSLELAVEGSSC